MPVWHEAAKQWRDEGRLVLLGIIQEQHADRCRLFAQWKGLDWPILHDPINLMESKVIPIFIAIDEHGIVRSTDPKVESFEETFLDQTFENDAPEPDEKSALPDLADLARRAEEEDSAAAWRDFGDALSLWGGPERLDDAVEAYRRAVERDPDNGNARFRLGVCLRARYESAHRRPGDFQEAVRHWGEALETDPNQYIWRRRIQQYGPRLEKPYAFYDWVDEATREIEARGEEPVTLSERPSGAELAEPSKVFTPAPDAPASPDPHGRIEHDEKGLIAVEIAVVPEGLEPGKPARVHITFRPNEELRAHWNNEVEPLRLWVSPPEGWKRVLEAPQGEAPETREVRHLDFEVQPPADAEGLVTLNAYALYYVCEDVGGQCLFLRKDIQVPLHKQRP